MLNVTDYIIVLAKRHAITWRRQDAQNAWLSIFFDLDKTLLNEQHGIDPTVRRALDELRLIVTNR